MEKKGILPQFGPLRSRDGERQLFRKSKDIRTNISGVLIIHFKGLGALFFDIFGEIQYFIDFFATQSSVNSWETFIKAFLHLFLPIDSILDHLK